MTNIRKTISLRSETNKAMEASAADDPSIPTTDINHWPCLSPEIALFILSHLPLEDLVKVSEVSKTFRDLSRDGSLWTELNLDYGDIKLKAESCRKLVERCKKLAILKISNKIAFHDPQINIMAMTVVIRAKDTLKRLEIDSSK